MSAVKCKDSLLYPLTHPQKRIWYLEKIFPNRSLHNIGGPIRVKGDVNFNVLESSINLFIKQHDGLRLRLIEDETDVRQYVHEYSKVHLDYFDFSQYEHSEEEFNKWVAEEAKKPFVLTNNRLFYFALFKISDNDNGYFAKFHHLICDGWSIQIMTDQICRNYMKLINGEEVDDRTSNSYTEYVDLEQKYLLSDRFQKNRNFWLDKFKVFPDTFVHNTSDRLEGNRKTFELDAQMYARIKVFAENYRCSLNTFFVTLYLIYLHKITQQDDLIIGTPVLNRSGKKEKSIFGMFTSTMPFRFTVENKSTVADMMMRVNDELQKCYFNQKYPYNLLVQDLELKKNGYDNLFHVCVNYYNTKLNSELNGHPIENVEFYNGNQHYALQIVVKDWSDSGHLTLDIDYKTNDYTADEIERMFNRLLLLINQILDDPSGHIRELHILTEVEKQKLLYDFNDTRSEYPKDKLIHELFEEQVEKTPQKTAISFQDVELTYKELNERANQLARFLVHKGVKAETIVALLMTHSIETVISILAVLKAGGAYLPIDPGYPSDRIAYMLDESDCKIVLANTDLSDNINFRGEIIDIGQLNLREEERANLPACNKPGDLVYVIFTSGSTGKPKGTMIEHQGLVNYIWWAKKTYVKSDDEIFPLYSSLAFDLTITSIFTPLISGSQIIVYDGSHDDDEYVLYRILKDNRATVIKLTPSHLSLLQGMNNKESSVRRFIVGGEDLNVSLAHEIFTSYGGNIEIYNEYGPTETVVGCMIHKYDHDNDTRVSVPIGVPADNVQIYILDKDLHAVPTNVIGEMYISGDGVARGYINRPEMTREKFIVHDSLANGRRLYKTGDLARFLDNGILEYVGRADQQTKIRGYRIELGEIENHLMKHGSIQDVIVADCEDDRKNRFLCAYYVGKPQAPEVKIDELKGYLSNYLPHYMIPAHFIELDRLPLTHNGKVNRKLLPKPVPVHNDQADFEFRNEKEAHLATAICNVLEMEKVSRKQNFYHLGGDSIKAIRIVSKLKEKGFKISVIDILSNPIIEEMALFIEQSKDAAIPQGPCEGMIKHTPIQSWFFAQGFANPNHYNQSLVLKVKQTVETKALEIVLNELIRHHDALRMNYNSQTGELFYNNRHLDKFFTVPEHDLSELSNDEQIARMTYLADRLKSSFHIEEDILIKACIFKLGKDERILLITAHHMVVDGVSWRIILDDMNSMLTQLIGKQEIKLPLKTHSYQEWARALENYRANLDNEKKYWEHILDKDLQFPIDDDTGEETVGTMITLTGELEEDITERLMTTAIKPYRIESKDLLITSLIRTIKAHCERDEIVIELEGHGRNELFRHIDISRTVGWFTSLYPFYIKLMEDDLPAQIKLIKEKIREIPNQGIGYGILANLSSDASGRKSKKYIRFNYLGDFRTGPDHPVTMLDMQLGADYDRRNRLTFVMEINAYVLNGVLKVNLSYSPRLLSNERMETFLDDYITDLKRIIHHCCEKESIEFTPSDFDAADLSQRELDSLFK